MRKGAPLKTGSIFNAKAFKTKKGKQKDEEDEVNFEGSSYTFDPFGSFDARKKAEEEKKKAEIEEKQQRKREEEEAAEAAAEATAPKRKQKAERVPERRRDNSERSRKSKSKKSGFNPLEAWRRLDRDELRRYLIFTAAGVFFIILLTLKYYEDTYGRFFSRRQDSDFQENLYELLEIDASASKSDIRSQFKALAKLWHPDKNPECGKPCEEKFSKINKAYEVLSDDERRRAYDQAAGEATPIKSKTVSLTEANFRRLVTSRNDVWIIQVYIDGDESCEEFASFWEESAMELGHTVHFGRINARTHASALQFLPYNVQLFPTVISWAPGKESLIFTPAERNLVRALRLFVERVLGDTVPMLRADDFKNKHGKITRGEVISKTSGKPEVVLITSSNRIPIEFKYASIKYEKFLNFFSNEFTEYRSIAAEFTNNTDVVLYYDRLAEDGRFQRMELPFDFRKNVKKAEVQGVVKLAKYLTIPSLDRSSFEEFCQRTDTTRPMGNEEDTESSAGVENLCVLIVRDKNDVKRKAREYVQSELSALQTRVLEGMSTLFDGFDNVHIAEVDLERHPRFAKLIQQLEEKYASKLSVIALLSPTNRVSFFDNTDELPDWIGDLLKGDEFVTWHYLTEFIGENNLSQYFTDEENPLLKKIFMDFVFHLWKWRSVFTMAALFYALKKAGLSDYINLIVNVGLLLLTSLSLSLMDHRSELFL